MRSPTAQPASATHSRSKASRTTPGLFTSGNPSINLSTQLHEIAHQWFGNTVTPQTWAVTSGSEGWANWSTWYRRYQTQGGDDPAALFDSLYASTPAEDWEIARRCFDGDPANLFE